VRCSRCGGATVGGETPTVVSQRCIDCGVEEVRRGAPPSDDSVSLAILESQNEPCGPNRRELGPVPKWWTRQNRGRYRSG
jgi:hypothetical protein